MPPPWLIAAWNFLELPLFTFLGAFVLYALNRLQGKQPLSLFLALGADLGTGARPIKVFFDMLLSSILFGGLVFALTAPTTVQQAIVVGLGTTGILSARTKATE